MRPEESAHDAKGLYRTFMRSRQIFGRVIQGDLSSEETLDRILDGYDTRPVAAVGLGLAVSGDSSGGAGQYQEQWRRAEPMEIDGLGEHGEGTRLVGDSESPGPSAEYGAASAPLAPIAPFAPSSLQQHSDGVGSLRKPEPAPGFL